MNARTRVTRQESQGSWQMINDDFCVIFQCFAITYLFKYSSSGLQLVTRCVSRVTWHMALSLYQVLCELFQSAPQRGNVPVSGNISGFIRRLFLQLMLEDEKVTVFLQSPCPVSSYFSRFLVGVEMMIGIHDNTPLVTSAYSIFVNPELPLKGKCGVFIVTQ